MRGAWRLSIAIWAAGLLIQPAIAAAQETPSSTSNTPATDAVGPRELQNFSLPGTVTRPADQPATGTPARTTPPPAARSPEAATETARPARRATPAEERAAPSSQTAQATVPRASTPIEQPLPAPTISPGLPPATSTPLATAPSTFAPEPEASSSRSGGLKFLPWLLAALALGAGGAFLFYRSRSRPALAGGAPIDLFVAPEPKAPSIPPPPRPAPAAVQPKPAPAPQPLPQPKPTSPASLGVVSTRLRPWLELSMVPLRCIVTDDTVTFEFELDVFNSGNGPARSILIEANVFNAGPSQDQAIARFFAEPVGQGERIDSILPLKHLIFRTQVVTPRANIQAIDAGERQVFVPLIAFNVLYSAASNDAQTSLSYLVGREGNGEKLAPFRLDLGPRLFRGLGARLLPGGVRR